MFRGFGLNIMRVFETGGSRTDPVMMALSLRLSSEAAPESPLSESILWPCTRLNGFFAILDDILVLLLIFNGGDTLPDIYAKPLPQPQRTLEEPL